MFAALKPAALIALVAVPVIAGVVRIAELASGATITADNARFFASPFPVIVHIVSAALFCVAGAFQFVPSLRRKNVVWHRRMGWVLTVCGLIAGATGLWMTLFYPRVEGDGPILFCLRLFFGAGLIACIVLGFTAIKRRDIARHGAWILRGYAIGMGAGTQFLVHVPWLIFFGKPSELARAILMGGAWVINLGFAEWRILRLKSKRDSRQTVV